MLTFSIRILVVIACVGAGSYELYKENRGGFLLIAAGAIFAYGHFRYGPVWLAFRAAKLGDLDRASKLISRVRNPAALSSQSRAYFEWIAGLVATERQQYEDAETHLRTALQHKLRTTNDRCLVTLALANVLGLRGAFAEALVFVGRAREIPCKPMVTQQINDLKEHIAGQSDDVA